MATVLSRFLDHEYPNEARRVFEFRPLNTCTPQLYSTPAQTTFG